VGSREAFSRLKEGIGGSLEKSILGKNKLGVKREVEGHIGSEKSDMDNTPTAARQRKSPGD